MTFLVYSIMQRWRKRCQGFFSYW